MAQFVLLEEARAKTRQKPVPGKLKGRIQFEIHTGEAMALLDGRRHGDEDNDAAGIVGLKGFARQTVQIMDASLEGDPLADWCLIRIEQQMDEISAWMEKEGKLLRTVARERLNTNVDSKARTSFESDVWSVTPIAQSLDSGHYASQALHRLIQFDDLVKLSKGLLHHDIITHKESLLFIREGGRKIRRLLSFGHLWDYTGCTRDLLKRQNARTGEILERLLKRGLIRSRDYGGPEEICKQFAEFGTVPRFRQSDSDGTMPDGSQEPSGIDHE